MTINNGVKSALIAVIGVLLLAGPMAFRSGCGMLSCCCCPEKSTEFAFEKGPCCGCGIAEDVPTPIQPAVNLTIVQPENIRPDSDYAYPGPIIMVDDFNLARKIIEIKSLSPPSIESRMSFPLLC